MARCVSCNKWGLGGFSKEGLCVSCNQNFNMMWDQYARILGDSVHLMNTSKKADTRLSRAQLALEKTDDMAELASQFRVLDQLREGIAQQRAQLESGMTEIIAEEIEGYRVDADSKSDIASTPRGTITPYEKHVAKCEKLSEFISNPAVIPRERDWAKTKIRTIEVSLLIVEAEKASFKGDTKKAIDKYKDALFHLKSDEVPDEEQQDEIQSIEQKINELERSV